MLGQIVKRSIRHAAAWFGIEIRRTNCMDSIPHGIESMEQFLQFLGEVGFYPRCILDVGANRASWSSLAATVFPEAKFVLVEPQQEMLPHLVDFCASNPPARFVAAGAGSVSGEAIQTIWDDLQGSSFFPQPDDNLLQSGHQRKTPIVTIDSIFSEEVLLPDLVKLDIQGFELEALRGASRLFGHTECFILEVSLYEFEPGIPDLYEVISFMHKKGYKLYDICGFLRRPLDNALAQLDLVFAKAGGRLCFDTRWSKVVGRPGMQPG